ncbi:hypothetical protein BGZ83_012104 [Gryganskiella cystojenkinii]|nr:hypothetical protein BGZ83_012104 [Gryganskiella cystojenkinii]
MTTAATEIMSPLFSSLSSSPSADLTASSAPPSLFTGPSAPSSPTSPSSTPAPKRRRHRVRPPTVKKPKKIKPTSFPCAEPDCDKKFSRAYNLTSHMKTHSTDRPFPCGICDLAFARRHDRERHFRLHSGDKPYNCGICGAGFMRNDALHRHQKLCGAAGSVFSIMSTDYFEEQQQQRMMMQQQLQQNQGEGFVDESTEGATELSLDYFKFE